MSTMNMLKRPITVLAGLVCYAAFMGAFMYAVEFVGTRIVPGMIDERHAAPRTGERRDEPRRHLPLLIASASPAPHLRNPSGSSAVDLFRFTQPRPKRKLTE